MSEHKSKAGWTKNLSKTGYVQFGPRLVDS